METDEGIKPFPPRRVAQPARPMMGAQGLELPGGDLLPLNGAVSSR
jgi:hypothetical protein